MTSIHFSESVVEEAALAWVEELGYLLLTISFTRSIRH